LEPIQKAAIARASAALRIATDNSGTAELARAFVEGAKTMLAADDGQAFPALRLHANEAIRKSATPTFVLGDQAWGGGDAHALAAGFIASIGQEDGLTALAKYARVFPGLIQYSLFASGFTANAVGEGAPKAVVHPGLSGDDADAKKAASIIVCSTELARASGDEAMRLFEAELRSGIVRGSNAALLSELSTAATTNVDATGDALADLRAGLAKAQPSNGYVAFGPHAFTADLATRSENTGGAGVRGGTFCAGVELVAVDDATAVTIVPASGIAMRDVGLTVRRAQHAMVQMDSAPDNPTTATTKMLSLWQNGLVALLAERGFRLALGNTEIVKVS